MERTFNDWREHVAGTLSSGDDAEVTYRNKMRDLRTQLWKLDEQQVEQTTALFRTEDMRGFAGKVAEYRALARKTTAAAESDQFPGI